MGHWKFNSSDPSNVRMEVTQADQFNNDEVSLAEALVRESIQNSSDAFLDARPVKVRFAIREVSGEEAKAISQQLQALRPHYAACKFDDSAVNAERFRVLAIEDFNTKGLTGSVVRPDEGNFDRFWRAVGDSGKKGKAGGRWGLGKLVYSSASGLKFFYGLTITADDPRPALLGQVVLSNHRIGDIFHPAHGFYFQERSQPLNLQQPVYDSAEIDRITALGGLSRTTQTGLSLIIPHVLNGIDEEAIISGVITNYYFPILAGRLIVEVGNTVIDKSTFMDVASSHKSVHPIPFDFVRQISETIDTRPVITSKTRLGGGEFGADSFTPEEIKQMKERFSKGEMVRVRVPVVLKPKAGGETSSHIDLYLKPLPEGAKPYALIARNAITLPSEKRYFGSSAAYGALIANDYDVSSFLGDAENPAHTGWYLKATKLVAGWRSPSGTLSAIRYSLRNLYGLIAEQAESQDNEALIDFFSILEKNQGPKGKKPKSRIPRPDIVPREKAIRIRARKGGFEVLAGPAAANWTFPKVIRVRVAYDMIGANPFKRHSPFDFDLSGSDIDMEASGASVEALKPNILKLTAESPEFRLECKGFDERRDIVVDARAA
jgi:hypothetical protein